MDKRFLDLYEEELRFLREMSGEFALAHPKIARRLTLDAGEVRDPFVERLLEGFAFLSARTRLRLEGEYPQFTSALLDLLSPIFTAPTPSMAVVQFNPDVADELLTFGFTTPRGTRLISRIEDIETPCEFRLCQETVIRPLEIEHAQLLDSTAQLAEMFPGRRNIKSALMLTIRSRAPAPIKAMRLDALRLFIRSQDDVADKILRLLVSHTSVVATIDDDERRREVVGARIRHVGFGDDDAILPQNDAILSAYRLIKEYFAMPERSRFVDIEGLSPATKDADGLAFQLFVGFSDNPAGLRDTISADNFALNCATVVNLFPRTADRISVAAGANEHHVVVDRTRPDDFEVYSVERVKGYFDNDGPPVDYSTLYAAGATQKPGAGGKYVVRRDEKRLEARRDSRYLGQEIVIGLSDQDGFAPGIALKQLSVDTLCSNRSVPLGLRVGAKFMLQGAAPIVDCAALVGPTPPRPAMNGGEAAWRLINALSLNHLSFDALPEENAALLRQTLGLFVNGEGPSQRVLIGGLKSLSTSPAFARLSGKGPASMARGLRFDLTIDSDAFRGVGAFGLASVLDVYFGRSADLNSFSKLVLSDHEKGVLAEWPARTGNIVID
jgi:type VI secretion system protein ImpG